MSKQGKKSKNLNKSQSRGAKRGGRLIYPLQMPRGPRGNNDGSISRDRTFGTEQMDYLKLMIYDSEKTNQYTYSGKGKNPGSTGNKDAILKTIYLYLPHELNETYSTSYDKVALGPFGDIAVEAMRSGNIDNIAQNIQQGAKNAKPEVAFNAVSGIFNGAASMFGVSGNMNKNQLAALAKGKVFNPYEETVFKGVNYRSHNFNFQMAPRNAEEAQAIENIITALRDAMLPNISGDARWLTVPRFFRCELVRYTPGKSATTAKLNDKLAAPERMSVLLTFPVNMVLTNMQVNLTPSGQHTSLRTANMDGVDYGPASYNLQLSFDETAFITRNMYNGGKKSK